MEQVLYRKYRPKTFKDAVGQEHVTKTLQKAIKSGRISHAYLFTGPRGVGKTSVARILAHEINGLDYHDESAHLDIIEIDAASNRRIDEIRDLRDKVRTAPAAAKYKVYIIDEVHMLTKEAFNALLKTLEEPPAHCIFILATTEAYKLPETIVSRTQRFEFKPVPAAKLAAHLGEMAKTENIDITPEALSILAEFGEGSFRDSIGYLDQLSAYGKKITGDDVSQVLGLPAAREIKAVIEALTAGDSKALVEALQQTKDQGVGAPELAASVSKQIRQQLIDGRGGLETALLLKQLIDVKASSHPYDYLEITLLEAAAKSGPSADGPGNHAAYLPAVVSSLKETPKPPAVNKIADSKPVIDAKSSQKTAAGEFTLEMWPDVVQSAKSRAASIYTALRLAQPELSGGSLILNFQFPLHKKKLEQAKNKALVAQLIEELCGQIITVNCAVNKDTKRVENNLIPEADPNTDDASLYSISSIFGSAEMLEI